MKRAILPILVAVLLLIVPAIPGMKSEETKTSGDAGVINLMIGNDDGFNIETVSAEQTTTEEFVNQIVDFRTWIENTRPFQDRKLTPEEINEIKTNINGLVDSLNAILEENDLDPISNEWLYREMFETEIGRSTIISVGTGWAFIPFYDYETFLGIMIRPMWLLYPPLIFGGGGYSGNINVNVLPPRIEYGDRLGPHVVRTTMFSGLYINIGDLGYDKILGGLMITIGQARVVMS